MASKIDTVTARVNLKPRHSPYWHKLRSECHLGYRKTTISSTGAWVARSRGVDGKYRVRSFGSLDGVPDHRRFDEAVKQATAWFNGRSVNAPYSEITVGEACKRYVIKQRADGNEQAAKDLESRFERWMYPNAQLTNTMLTRLTTSQISAWRQKLTTEPIILQDRTKLSTKPKSAGSINREMAVLKAALNLAVRDGFATSDAAWKHSLTPVKNATGRRECYLDAAQRKALVASAPNDLAALLMALSLVPLRPGAMAALTVSNLDKRLSVLTVGKDKAGRDRKIKLPPVTTEFFAKQAGEKRADEPLVARADGKPWNKDSWKYPFKEAARIAKLPADATAYTLRHSTITDLIALHRLDTMTVATLSGTSLLMIEKHYGHLLHEHSADALAMLAF